MVEWWLLSPNPVSIVMYSAWAVWGMRKFKHLYYKRLPWFYQWFDALMCAGWVVIFGDTMWLIATFIRWVPVYPQWTMQVVYSLLRNFTVFALLYMFTKDNLPLLKWGKEVWVMWGVNAYFLLIWFGTAEVLYETHWVHAYLNGANWFYGWFMAFVMGRIITTIIYMRQWFNV